MSPGTHPVKLLNRSENQKDAPPRAKTTTTKGRSQHANRGGIKKRGRPRGHPPNRFPIHIQQTESSTCTSDTSDPSAHVTTDQELSAPPINARYRLRRNRVPRYRCGTRSLHDCTCNLIQSDITITPQGILLIKKITKPPQVNQLVICAGKI